MSFPRPVRDYSTREVLVEEFENALPLKWFLRNGGGEYDEQLAGMGLDAFLVSSDFPSCRNEGREKDERRRDASKLTFRFVWIEQNMLLLDNWTREHLS